MKNEAALAREPSAAASAPEPGATAGGGKSGAPVPGAPWRARVLGAARPLIDGAAAFIGALIICALILLAVGDSPAEAFRAIFLRSVADGAALGNVLLAATRLMFVGYCVSLAFRSGLFNIGAEGQVILGGLACGIGAHYARQWSGAGGGLHGWPPAVVMAGLMLAAAAGGAAWAAIPAGLKVWRGAHEVISTIMMNMIAAAVVLYALRPGGQSFAVPGKVRTVALPEALRIPQLAKTFPALQGSRVGWLLLLAVALGPLLYWVLFRTRFGFEVRAVGHNPTAARLAGIADKRVQFTAFCLSGALAGLVGAEAVLSTQGYFVEGFSAGVGYMGIAVALLAGSQPLAIPPAAFLFGMLSYSKVAASEAVPKEIIDVFQGLFILGVVILRRK